MTNSWTISAEGFFDAYVGGSYERSRKVSVSNCYDGGPAKDRVRIIVDGREAWLDKDDAEELFRRALVHLQD